MERLADPDLVGYSNRQGGVAARPTLAELANRDAGELARCLELALPRADAQANTPFNSAI
ncbi:hypothetical protein GCM10009639_55510 [Kitasatospora putterlickiae]|uniref:Uncharacterized protein n=1 Tax=Kitasatospora putterlickiae TaxID=221725 RepID=A0ABN1YE66_9ACTN